MGNIINEVETKNSDIKEVDINFTYNNSIDMQNNIE